jgi:hypothetical protein
MMMTNLRLRQIGWGVLLGACIAAFAALSLSVHAVRNEVLQSDIKLVKLKKQKLRLETEFQARASQHQLARWNQVDLGYVAPRADQYLDGSVQLAALGQSDSMQGPAPIRVARADLNVERVSADRPMVSPISGTPITLASANVSQGAGSLLSEAISGFLIEASPIREAKAETSSTYIAEATE